VGWADVATRHDLLELERRIDLRFDAADTRMEARFSQIDARFEQVEARFETTEHKILGTLERELRRQTWRMFAVYAASMGAFIGALVAVADV
jgi:hypothetical protein